MGIPKRPVSRPIKSLHYSKSIMSHHSGFPTLPAFAIHAFLRQDASSAPRFEIEAGGTA